mmetsp:Transcript_16784/g.26050  ORF Transcript_16784/g.26050 Transcript_16784/m.26050 type:complete len:209 (+) Transcript_16784:36-662(+)
MMNYNRIDIWHYIIIILVTTFIPHCFAQECDLTCQQEALNNARALWTSKSIVNYDYQFARDCFCLPIIFALKDVQVRNNEITSITFANPNDPDLPDEVPDDFVVPAILDIFDRIQNGIDRSAPRMSVMYDGQYGYPLNVYIDYDETLADEEYIVRIPSFSNLSIPDDGGTTGSIGVSPWSSPDFSQRLASISRRRTIPRSTPRVSRFQ